MMTPFDRAPLDHEERFRLMASGHYVRQARKAKWERNAHAIVGLLFFMIIFGLAVIL